MELSKSGRKIWSEEQLDSKRVCEIFHNFDDHPAFQLESLRELAIRMGALNSGYIKFIDPEIKEDSKFYLATESYDGRSIEKVFDSINKEGTWLAIYEAHRDPQFKTVVDEVIEAGMDLFAHEKLKPFELSAYIFISHPPTLTPFHIDRENNFLLQIKGIKHLSVWEPTNRQVVSQQSYDEKLVFNRMRGVKYHNNYQDSVLIDDQIPAGRGIFMPPGSPHLTHTEFTSSDAGVSVTIGFVFYSQRTRKQIFVSTSNVVLRKLRLGSLANKSSQFLNFVKHLFGTFIAYALIFSGKLKKPPGL